MDIPGEENKIVPLLIRTDVTAVKLCGDFVLAGIGSWIQVYHKRTGQFIIQLQALIGQKSYGFRTSENSTQILVFGGKQFTVVLIDCIDFKGITKLFEPIVCDDWIHDGVWIQKNEVALLTAHNVVQVWNTAHQTLLRSYRSEDNSILYSGLLVPLKDDVLVLAGTVFSEVIIHICKDEKPLHRLTGHQGVIFSIACNLDKHLIVTTSDDRSVRVWHCKHDDEHSLDSPSSRAYWENATLSIQYALYGHTARVMRSFITNDMIISVGEDAAICFWDLNGNYLDTTSSHQGAAIWSLDVDQTHLVTGGGDGAVIVHPLTVATDDGRALEDVDLNAKKVFFTARRNIVILSEDHKVAYYDIELKYVTSKHALNHESTFVLMSLSSCKQLLAVADMNGNLDIFAENCVGEVAMTNVLKTKLNIGKVMSMQWAGNRHIVLCSETGVVSVLASKGKHIESLTTFQLPSKTKEPWLTASAFCPYNKIFVLGERNGNIDIFVVGERDPVKTFPKVHGRYGPQMITVRDKEIITTGRDGCIKQFAIQDDTSVAYMNSLQLPFAWVEKFLDRQENVICGFRERAFVVFDIDNRSTLLEVHCGGGHRSWDAVRYFEKVDDTYEEFITLMYLKNSSDLVSPYQRRIHLATFQLSKIVSKNIIHGSHSKEINCLKSLTCNLDQSTTFYISGGEDTSLRISSFKQMNTGSIYRDEIIFRHISSIRTLKTYAVDENKTMLVSAGGRAQICIKMIRFDKSSEGVKLLTEELIDYQIHGTDKERKGNQSWRSRTANFDPETRIMDVDVLKTKDAEYAIVAGCSDASLRIFNFEYHSKSKGTFKLIGDVKYHKTCILKTHFFRFQNKVILITTTTRGEVAFWDFTEALKERGDLSEISPFFLTRTNKSGINSISVHVTAENEIIVATGGDDNSIQVSCLRINMENLAVIISSKTSVVNFHCSEITGLELIMDNYLISTSIDQRVTLAKWSRNSDEIKLAFVEQTFCDVADVQGFHVVEEKRGSVTVCVFGKGVHILEIVKK